MGSGITPLALVARDAGISTRQLRYWVDLGLVRAVRVDRSDTRHYWYVRDADVAWVRSLARLVLSGVAVEALASAAREGLLPAALVQIAAVAQHTSVPAWLTKGGGEVMPA